MAWGGGGGEEGGGAQSEGGRGCALTAAVGWQKMRVGRCGVGGAEWGIRSTVRGLGEGEMEARMRLLGA